MEDRGLCSVIVPVYNVESQLKRCIASLSCQTYPFLEIILVDDGSTDTSGAICDEAARLDKRIRVIHKENAGLGMARNSGLEQASGEYILFVDSDDYVEPNYAEVLLEALLEYQADVVLMGHIRDRSDGTKIPKPITANRECVDHRKIIDRVLLPIIGAKPDHCGDVELEMSVCMSIYRGSIIRQTGLRFLSEREVVSEDLFFNIHYVLQCKSAVLISECLYHYVDNSNSLTNTYRADRFEKYCKMLRHQQQILKEYGLLERAELRQCRTFIMKTKKCIASIAASSLPFKAKRAECKKILGSAVLAEILKSYEKSAFTANQKLQVYMLKHKMTNALLLFYGLRGTSKK